MNELVKAASFYFVSICKEPIRIIERDNTQWFVVKDICDVLEIKQPTRAVEDIPGCEVSTIHITSPQICNVNNVHTLSKKSRARKTQKMLIVNEAGLYRLVFKSRKPEAERFKTWVFNEVLPSIRKYGFFRASLPKIWIYRGKEYTWGEWVNKKREAYFRRFPDASDEDFEATLPG